MSWVLLAVALFTIDCARGEFVAYTKVQDVPLERVRLEKPQDPVNISLLYHCRSTTDHVSPYFSIMEAIK